MSVLLEELPGFSEHFAEHLAVVDSKVLASLSVPQGIHLFPYLF